MTTATTKPPGFPLSDIDTLDSYLAGDCEVLDGETPCQIYFIEAKGKDASFNRWRVVLYYAAHLAKTAFFYTEQAYSAFLAEYQPKCYQDYDQYRATSNG